MNLDSVLRRAASMAIVTSILIPSAALAAPVGAGAPMPWTGPLQGLLDNLSGTTARILGALANVFSAAPHDRGIGTCLALYIPHYIPQPPTHRSMRGLAASSKILNFNDFQNRDGGI
jgi:hypothetical protein